MKTRYNGQLDVMKDRIYEGEEKSKKFDERLEKEKMMVENSQKLFRKMIKDLQKEMKEDPKRKDTANVQHLSQTMNDFLEYVKGKLSTKQMTDCLFPKSESLRLLSSFKLVDHD